MRYSAEVVALGFRTGPALRPSSTNASLRAAHRSSIGRCTISAEAYRPRCTSGSGCRRPVVEVILAHAGGHKAGVAGVYNKALYLDERRRALERWADHLHELVTGEVKAAQIVRLPGKRK